MSGFVNPRPERTSAKIGTSISTPLVVPSLRRTCGDCAKPTTATSRIRRPRCARRGWPSLRLRFAPQASLTAGLAALGAAGLASAFGSLRKRRSQMLLERVVVGVRLARRPEVGDVLQPGDLFRARFPD